jgi:hypothetical protein
MIKILSLSIIIFPLSFVLNGCGYNEIAEYENAQKQCNSSVTQFILGKNNRDAAFTDNLSVETAYIGKPLGGIILTKVNSIVTTNKVFIREINPSNTKETKLDFKPENTKITLVSNAGFNPTQVLICTNSK